MKEDIQIFEEIVVSASRYEQKLSETVVSMEVIKPKFLENNNVTQMDMAIKNLPGVDVISEQPSIRGGSGYSYGTGSRVLLLVDDMPMLSPDAADIKWNFIPIENISQVEVIKGASSSLFGSSALNGVINIRTAYPKDKPETKVIIFNGLYMNPKRKELIWWHEAQPLFAGANIFHMEKIKNLDVVIGAHGYSNSGYREYETEERLRGNINLRYRFKKIKGLSVGLNTNVMNFDKTEFFLWQNADSGAYRQNPQTITRNIGTRLNIDPYFIYHKNDSIKHTLRTRYFWIKNRIPDNPSKNSNSDLYYIEYLFQRKTKTNLTYTVGALNTYSKINGGLYEKHDASNIALFGQIDKKIKKLIVLIGLRAEYYRIDKMESKTVIQGDTIKDIPIYPVGRFGLNYQLFEHTFLRASFGQGYRFPSIAEKFTYTSLGGINIFPNPQIKPETGWSSEVGVKQALVVSKWTGLLDFSVFWTEYHKMMEFIFGFYDPITFRPLNIKDSADLNIISTHGFKALGFQSRNIGNALIRGFEITLTGTGKFFRIPATLLLGYTYIDPIDLNDSDSSKSTSSKMLKYRYKHSLKGDFQLDFKSISTGINISYRSFIVNIDKVFEDFLGDGPGGYELLPGLYEYRQKHNKGVIITDFRISWNINQQSKLSLVIKNLFNKEYMERPGDIRPPRNISLQYVLSI